MGIVRSGAEGKRGDWRAEVHNFAEMSRMGPMGLYGSNGTGDSEERASGRRPQTGCSLTRIDRQVWELGLLGADAFVEALAGVFAVVVVELLGEFFAVGFVFDGLDQHFGREPVLFEDMVAGADVNALLEFQDAALVVQVSASVRDHAAVQ